ncbi:MAG TPA: alpha/beta hydrolase [Pedococcus sp.]|jgi:pimeloyl-ACP methyl ester carboxylesterase
MTSAALPGGGPAPEPSRPRLRSVRDLSAVGDLPGAPRSQWVDLDGPVHYLDFGGPADGPLLLLVHGLGGSVLSWSAVAPTLARTARVVAVDLAGFGRTEGLGRSTSVHDNTRLLVRFVDEVCRQPVVLVGNSMGGLIALLLSAQRPDLLAGLVLIDPALPVGPTARPDPLVTLLFGMYAVPAVGRLVMERRRSLISAEQQARAVLRLCTVDPHRVDRAVLEQHLHLAREREAFADIDAELVAAARSLVFVIARRRWLGRVMRGVTVPVLLLHGSRDRLVPLAAARATAAANPTWRFEVARDVGHVPQLEAPEWTLGHLLDWLGDEGAIATLAALPPRG